MKRILTLLIAVVLFTACNNKQTKPVETLITTESAKFTLTVINNRPRYGMGSNMGYDRSRFWSSESR